MRGNRYSKNNKIVKVIIIIGANLILATLVLGIVCVIFDKSLEDFGFDFTYSKEVLKPEINEKLLTINEYSRPGTPLNEVNGIVIHYTANPGTSAINNRDYFEGLRISKTTSASSHFIIGINGEIVQCIPLNEIAYATSERNIDTISIECCHKSKDGKFTKETYNSLVQLVSWLLCEYNLKSNSVIRHFDVTGKNCPKYYVEHEDKWEQLKEDIKQYIKENNIK